ncbi:hypothetical protein L3Q82_019837 [Scortum barcoo]|uniref:Uncharacterized protein n=1 Tax=Scortum barcoo TaxID=214431 RepID=A0ACB8VCJ7_9TELE|nr:hypothetical protein L3Q82_019837 [Scortum barcoo]
MDGEACLVSGGGHRERKRSFRDLMMDVEELEEPDSDCEDSSNKRLYKEPKGFLNKKRQHSGNCGAQPELYGAESSDFLPDYPICVPQDRWGRVGEEDIQDKLLHSSCTTEGSIDQASPSSMLEHWVHLDNQHNMADCPITINIIPPATPVTHRPCPFIPVPSSLTAIDFTMSSVVDPMVSSPVIDSHSPISSVCSPVSSDWDTLRSTSSSPGCSDVDPVSAAAHLHLLGESLSLIGHHLQETDKMVSMSSGLSLLLDSLLCALGPLICLTSQIPELTSCTQHTLDTPPTPHPGMLSKLQTKKPVVCMQKYIYKCVHVCKSSKLGVVVCLFVDCAFDPVLVVSLFPAMSEHLTGSYGALPPELRLVLLGNIGCGKTSSADTILSQLSHISPIASRSCQLRQGLSDGRRVTLVEAPRWYWTGGKMEDNVRKETERAITMVEPGPHAILLLVPVSQFTEMEGRVPAELEELFGEEALDHTLVLLTCGDYLMGRTVEDYLQKEHPGLRQIIERCGGRYHVINNRQRQDREQVCELLEKVDNMVRENGVYYTKTTQERELEKRVKERKRELMQSYRAQEESRRETVASMHVPTMETLRSVDRGEEYSTAFQRRRREERDMMEDRVDVSQVSNGLHSTPAPERRSYSEPHYERQVKRTPSFRLNAVHHRINSFEERSPGASPTSAPHSPVFSSSPSLPTFASSASSFLSSSSSSPELRLVLLGRSGAGKSAAGNGILGREEFESSPESLTAITQKCEKKKALVEGRQVAVVDTPDWFNSEQTPDEVQAQISSCVALSSPGPHAFLLCVPLDQPSKTELQALRTVEAVFGPEAVQKHTLVLFTYADRLRESGKMGNSSVEAYIASQRGDLLKLVEKCGDRFHVMKTRGSGRERRNVADLLEKVEQTVKEAGGQCYSSPAFQEAENRVRQRQVEIAKERKGRTLEEQRLGDVRQFSFERRSLYPNMQPVAEAEEEVREDEIEKTRDEAELSVSNMKIESLPPVTLSNLSPSLLRSLMEKMESSAKMLPKLLADSSVWVGEEAQKVKSSPVWEQVSSGAQNVHKMVADSAVWEKVGASAGHVSKLVGDRVPKVVVDGSAWVGSGAKAAAASPLWGKVGSGAKSGAKLVADSSMLVGSGIGVGAKNLAQSPVWGKVGSGAKAGAKMVAESSVWEKIGTTAKQMPRVVIVGAVLGLVLGVFFGGVIGGAVGAAAGSAVTEVGRRKFSNKNMSEKADEAARNVERRVNDSMDSLVKQRDKMLKTE